MKTPRISVVTPSFNSIRTIRQTIESVLHQKYPDLQHLVIDGGSTDGTVELLRQYSHLIWVSEKDQGHYDAMNKGITRADGDLITILNSDDCLRSHALAEVSEAFQKNPGWDAAFGDVVCVDGEGREIYRREEAGYDYRILRYWRNYLCHQTLFVKKAVHDRIGLYRHREFLNCCDYEFFLRMGREQCSVGHIRALLVDYRFHAYGQSADLRVAQNMIREFELIRREYGVSSRWAKVLSIYGRFLRQFQKLLYRGKCDLIPGNWLLRKHMHDRTHFSSNCAVDQLGTKP